MTTHNISSNPRNSKKYRNYFLNFFCRVCVKHFGRCLILIYIVSFLTSVPPTLFETKFVNGTCKGELAFSSAHLDRFYDAYSILWYVTSYMIPCCIFIVFYSMIIHVLLASKNMVKHGSSKTVDKASKEITKMAICVISIFIVTLGFDNTLYMLSYWGHVDYTYGNALQVAGLLITTLNSVGNPFVYTLMLPTFRRSLMKALGCGKTSEPKTLRPEDTTSTSAPNITNTI